MRPGSQGEKRIRNRVCRRLFMTLGSLGPWAGLSVGEMDENERTMFSQALGEWTGTWTDVA